MAGAGAKKRHEENRKHISMLRLWLAAGILSFLLVRMVYLGGSASTTLWVAFVATSLVAYVCYRGIAALAAPTYGPRGELLDGGADMSMKGFCGHYHDLLYITVIVQGLVVFTPAPTPPEAFMQMACHNCGVWHTLTLFMIVYAAPRQKEQVMDEETRKRMDKAEKRAQRRANKWR